MGSDLRLTEPIVLIPWSAFMRGELARILGIQPVTKAVVVSFNVMMSGSEHPK